GDSRRACDNAGPVPGRLVVRDVLGALPMLVSSFRRLRERTLMTRTRWILAIALPLVVLLALPLIASAGSVGPGGKRRYAGKTSQGQRHVSFTTVRKGGGWAVSDLEFDFRMRC